MYYHYPDHVSSFRKIVYALDWIFKAMKLYICRGTCQPFCRSLPDDPLLECFTSTDDLSIQGLLFLHLFPIQMHKTFFISTGGRRPNKIDVRIIKRGNIIM